MCINFVCSYVHVCVYLLAQRKIHCKIKEALTCGVNSNNVNKINILLSGMYAHATLMVLYSSSQSVISF